MNCGTEDLIKKITNKKLDKSVEVSFSVFGKLPDCKRINTEDVLKVLSSSDAEITTGFDYNPYNIPANMFECHGGECENTGTFYPGQSGAKAFYYLPYHAAEFASGIITFYVTGFTGSKNVTLTISDTEAQTNADVYTVSAKGIAGEFTPVAIDLSGTPTSTVGTGYTPADFGAYINISIADANAGISSIAVFDSIKDFEINNTVTVGCLTEITGDDAIDAAEASCDEAGYDLTNPVSFERTVVGNRVTANYDLLNPVMGRGEGTKGQEIYKTRMTVEADGSLGKVVIPDISAEECGFVTVMSDCATLKRIDLATKIALDDDQYNLIPNEDGTYSLYVNAHLVGKELFIAYPRDVEVEELVADERNVGGVQTVMRVPFSEENGRHGYYLYGNVFVTSFPVSLTTDNTEFSFTISIQRQKDGHLYKKVYIL